MNKDIEKNFEASFSYKLIYIFRINDKEHLNKLKIGEATVHTDKNYNELLPNCEELNDAAKKRIDEYTSTAGIRYELLYTEVAVKTNKSGKIETFSDKDVHEVLLRSNIKRFYFDTNKSQNEWFVVNLETAKNAIKAVKENRKSLFAGERNYTPDPIILRPEQEEAVNKTIAQFNKSDRMLWNAKMRFGKTITALEIVKRQNYKRTIIITHRPVVDKGWYDDFGKVFCEKDTQYQYGSKSKGESLDYLLASNKPFVYFASMQDLRGSEKVGGKFEKNEKVFNTDWDLVVVDEAHEGTKTEKGVTTLEGVIKIDDNYPTKILELSGTAFNLLDDYDENQIYTWDYIMEQQAKLDWNEKHYGDPNPYEDLPELKIYTYDLNKYLPGYEAVYDKAFNFKEFFRVWTGDVQKDGQELPSYDLKGRFVHETDVKKFLDMLCKTDSNNNYPYSTEKYRNYFRHSLWTVPGVKEARALSKLLQQHSVFGSGQFNIINIAGDGDEEVQNEDALKLVEDGIGRHPEDTYSITLTCGKLTTGVTVKPWTAVFMLSGSYNTSASAYLQTIFRVQSPANIGGKRKEKCYVFDFAPDRSLKVVADATKLSIKSGDTSNDKTLINKFLNFCPIISVDGSSMTPYSVDSMMGQLKKAYADRVVANGFDDNHIYNDNILKLDENALAKFDDLRRIVGTSKQTKKVEKIDINNQGFTDEEYEKLKKAESKPKHELTEEEKELIEEAKKKRKEASTAISILRAISIRIPLLIYGANIKDDEDITAENLPDIVDDASWQEFMPTGVTKEMYKDFTQYYEHDIFIEAGRKIRSAAKYADTLEPTERVKEIAQIFSSFRNPDKETVLTPWQTVNMHMSDCIGGYTFFERVENEDDATFKVVSLEEPKFISQGEVTNLVLNNTNSKVLEINSKSGLYPLYVSYSLYRQKCLNVDEKKLTEELKQILWDEVLNDNIYVLCKTPMAKTITERTLVGYRNVKTNIVSDNDIIYKIENNSSEYAKEINNSNFWNKEGEKMNFSAIVGNPPYQVLDGGGGSSAKPVYNYYVDFAKKINPGFISMIMPSRWMTGGKGLDNFRKEMIEDRHIRILNDYTDSHECFSNVNIEGGVCYFLWDSSSVGKCEMYNHLADGTIKESQRYLKENNNFDVVIRDAESVQILNKVMSFNFKSFSKLVLPRNAFKIDNNIDKFYAKEKTTIKLLARIDNSRQYRYIKENYKLNDHLKVYDKFKIFVSKADGAAGQLGNPIPAKIIGKSEYGFPGDICTETFLVIGGFESKNEMMNVAKYLKTKFCRFLIGIRKNKNMTSDTYKFVPILNFKDNSNINWDSSIENIDTQLYKYYNLSKEEISFIESRIKSSEN